jgi:hypothetical protein
MVTRLVKTEGADMNDTTRTSWWQRNWKWFVPVGCLGLIAMVGGAIVGLLFLVFGLIKSADVYQDALSQAQNHPAVQRELGQPIEAGWLVMGNISLEGTSGEADITIPVSGPNGEARVYVVASKTAGQWTYQLLEVEFSESGQRLNLLE